MIKPNIIRALSGTALVLCLGACGAVIFASNDVYNALSFKKSGEVEYAGSTYSFAYFNNAGSMAMGSSRLVTCPVDARQVDEEVVVVEYADRGAQLISLTRLDGDQIGCEEFENWHSDVYPVAVKACKQINQTPRPLSKEKNVYLQDDGVIHLWEVCV